MTLGDSKKSSTTGGKTHACNALSAPAQKCYRGQMEEWNRSRTNLGLFNLADRRIVDKNLNVS